jgi:drug/metabolite transporter (DMT)-like permease
VDHPRFDIALGAVCALLGISLLVPSYQEGARVFLIPGDISPYFVPKVFLYCWIVLSLGILAKGLVNLRRHTESPPQHKWMMIISTFVICVFATALLKPLGYLVVAPVAVFLSVWMLGYRNYLLNGVVSLGVSVGLYLLLVRVAGLSLPASPWLGV